ncbi:hypothetical protein ACVAAS_003574 [Enterobacter roggenkampii]
MMDREIYQVRWLYRQSQAEQLYSLECFGDHLACVHKYPQGILGLEAIYLYLFHKYSWSIEKTRCMDAMDIKLCLSVEMKGWTLPPEAKFRSSSCEDIITSNL